LPALTKVLAASPPWRRNLISFLAQEPQGWAVMQRLFESLRKAGDETPASEMRLLLSSLESQGNFEQAYFVWLDSLDASGLARVQNVYDGGFDMEPQGLFFDWTLRRVKNAQIDILNRPGSTSPITRAPSPTSRNICVFRPDNTSCTMMCRCRTSLRRVVWCGA
jgi:hypothetical protein